MNVKLKLKVDLTLKLQLKLKIEGEVKVVDKSKVGGGVEGDNAGGWEGEV